MNLSKLVADSTVGCDQDISSIEIKGLTCDSRQVKQGFLFAAFKGEVVDGMRFADKAAALGASVLLCDEAAEVPQELAGQLVVLRAANPRQIFAHMAGRFYNKQPAHMVAVTGTNGKTSVAHFCRQIWALCGEKSASIGTIGSEDSDGNHYEVAGLTTPDAVGLHDVLRQMAENDVHYAAMEASSHGLSQYRQDGVRLEAAGFTSFSRDHLDYHKTEANYFAAKSRLFEELLPKNGIAVLNADIKEFAALKHICDARGIAVLTYGEEADDLRIMALSKKEGKQVIRFHYEGEEHEVVSSLLGKFQAYNLLCALGLVIASGVNAKKAIAVLDKVKAVRGRMEQVGTYQGAQVFVDYAHTPDGLEKALYELKAYASGRLIALFGCGGDRDKGKRPQMGEVASRLADKVIVTDDNPRTEDAATIRKEILAACGKNAVEVPNRAEAIAQAVKMLAQGDILLLAGKGHEDYQIIGTEKYPLDEKKIVNNILNGKTDDA